MPILGVASRRFIFTVSLTCISRFCVTWDWLRGYRKQHLDQDNSSATLSRVTISSGRNTLDAVFAEPAFTSVTSAVLICHGIGETVEYWFGVQRLLAANGIASLVFDYSGYGRSSGRIDASHCERDAVSAFRHLQHLAPSGSVSLLGFSLGSGIAAAIVDKVSAHRLVLCAVFTSFKAAAFSIGFPRTLSWMVPDIWRTEDSLKTCAVPVMIVHGGRDELFAVQMASALKAACRKAELFILPQLSHNEPHTHPRRSYWIETIGSFLMQ